MKKTLTLFAFILTTLLFTTGCTQQRGSTPLERVTPSPTSGIEELNSTATPNLSTSTEVRDLERELHQTVIEPEDFSDL